MWTRIIRKHTIQIRKLLQRPLVIVGLANGDRREGGLPLEEQGIWREADHGAALGQRQQQQVETPCWSDQHQDPEQPVSAWDSPIAYCVIRRVDLVGKIVLRLPHYTTLHRQIRAINQPKTRVPWAVSLEVSSNSP